MASIYLYNTNMNHMDLSDNFLSDNFPSAKLWNSSAFLRNYLFTKCMNLDIIRSVEMRQT